MLDGDVAIFGVGASAFILQRYYKKEWAENCMMQLMVDDLDAWWEHMSSEFAEDSVFNRQRRQPCSLGITRRLRLGPVRRLWHVTGQKKLPLISCA